MAKRRAEAVAGAGFALVLALAGLSGCTCAGPTRQAGPAPVNDSEPARPELMAPANDGGPALQDAAAPKAAVPAEPQAESKAAERPSAPASGSVQVSFKLDRRITRGTYSGDRWISPPTYLAIQKGGQAVVDARAWRADAQGRVVRTRPEWTPSDPALVSVDPAEGNQVRITVKGEGESRIEVSSQGAVRTLAVKATEYYDGLKVEISQ